MREKRARIDPNEIFLGLLLTVTVFRMFYTTLIPLSGDEAYHWEWSRHLAFGYYDHPPLIGWLIAFFTLIGGQSLFWTRLTAVLAVTGVTYLTYRFGRELGGETVGLTAGMFCIAATAMTFGALMVSTDSPLLFFWQLTVFLIWRALETRKPLYWYLGGVALGFGMLSKFLILPLLAGIALFLLFSSKDRYWFKRKEPYLAFGLAVLIFMPFLIWNAQNGWTSFVFHVTRHKPDINLIRPLQFLGSEAVLLSPLLFGGMIWSVFRLFNKLWKPDAEGKDQRAALFLLLTGWLLPGFLFLDSVRNSFGAHWPVAAYGTALVGLAWVLSWKKKNNNPNSKIKGGWFWGSAMVWTVLLVTLTLNPAIAGKILGQDVGEAYGWEEIGQRVSELHRELGPETILATKSYAFSSLISYYTPDHLYVSLIGPGSKHGRAYDIWDQWPEWVGRDVLVISKEDPRVSGSSITELLDRNFTKYELKDIIQIKSHGKVVRTVFCTLGHNLKKDYYAVDRQKYRW